VRPRLGFLGVGWIGRDRLEAVIEDGGASVVGLSDPSAEACARASALAKDAAVVPDLDSLLELPLDAVVIATPSALHVEQSVQALERGVAVFCQKPLGRTAHEVDTVIAAAKTADRRLGVDFSYRYTAALRALKDLTASGELGEPYAIDLTFHNAYGPDKAWYRDPALSGGGCLMDLGIHLVDAALWLLDFPEVARASASRFRQGQPVHTDADEDYAIGEVHFTTGTVARLACSWWLPAGREAVIEATVWGTRGGATFRNVQGSFYDFVTECFHGTETRRVVEPPDDWGGRGLVAFTHALARSGSYDPEADTLVTVSQVLDQLYGRPAPYDTLRRPERPVEPHPR
jgi:predicted dehydrogenase